MAISIWGNNNLNGISVNADAGDQFDPAVADSGGGSFGVAWASAAGVEVRFFDVLGEPDPALGSFTLNSNIPGATVGQTSMSMGGAGIGYGVTWQETSAGGTTAVNLRYIGLSAPVGGVINVASGNPELVVHDVAMSGYTAVDATFRPLSTIDGLNVAWIKTDISAASPLTAAQIDAGYGEVMLQRYAVPLDAKKDPAGPPVAAGLDGASDAPVSLAAIGRDVVVASDAHLSGDSVVAWIDAANVVQPTSTRRMAPRSPPQAVRSQGESTLPIWVQPQRRAKFRSFLMEPDLSWLGPRRMMFPDVFLQWVQHRILLQQAPRSISSVLQICRLARRLTESFR